MVKSWALTDACELNSSGYCEDKRAVDKACFCRNVSYNSCGGSCQIFETRIDYVNWLHDLCGNVEDWHGLPENWHQLTAPTSLEMIPWRWTLKSSNESKPIGVTDQCVSNTWKLGSFALVNIATVFAILLGQRIKIARRFLSSHSWRWLFRGTLIVILQLLANWFNTVLVHKTPGYEKVPTYQLMLLWSSIPRVTWLPILLIGMQPFEAMNFSVAGSYLFAEVIFQSLSVYYMFMTINYGRQHFFYIGGFGRAERGEQAEIMYAGALMWLIVFGLAYIYLMRAAVKINKMTEASGRDFKNW